MRDRMNYKKLIDVIEYESDLDKDPYLLNNHNGELVNGSQINLLDASVFPIEIIHEINRILHVDFQDISITASDFTVLNRMVFIGRLEALARYYKKTQREQDAYMLEGLADKIGQINTNEVTVTKEPNLFALDKQFHPALLMNISIRRVLYGFVIFRKLHREDILNHLQAASLSS